MEKKVKIIFYVDIHDNTKGALCAIPSDKDMRNESTISEIADTICDVFAWDLFVCDNCMNIAKSIAYHEFSACNEYEFGVEEIKLIED